MTAKMDKNHNYGKFYLINSANELIFESLKIELVKEKKARLDFIARAKNTYYPTKFRIVNTKLEMI
jgi:hypothetical protein